MASNSIVYCIVLSIYHKAGSLFISLQPSYGISNCENNGKRTCIPPIEFKVQWIECVTIALTSCNSVEIKYKTLEKKWEKRIIIWMRKNWCAGGREDEKMEESRQWMEKRILYTAHKHAFIDTGGIMANRFVSWVKSRNSWMAKQGFCPHFSYNFHAAFFHRFLFNITRNRIFGILSLYKGI